MGWFSRFWWWHQRPELSVRDVVFMDGMLGVCDCSSRCRALLEEERSRLEASLREVAVLKAEREALLLRLESARRELMT